MGNPIKDTVEDFGTGGFDIENIKDINFAVENSPYTEIPDGAVEHMRNEHKKNIARMVKAEAVKNDRDKTRMDLLPPKALEGIAKIFTFGAKKYNDYNYKNGEGLDWSRPYAAMIRHLNAWNDGEDNDPETGQSHLYHAGCCIMMLIDLVDSEKGKDTRFRNYVEY